MRWRSGGERKFVLMFWVIYFVFRSSLFPAPWNTMRFSAGFNQKCRAFRAALKIKKNKAPAFRSLIGHWITNV